MRFHLHWWKSAGELRTCRCGAVQHEHLYHVADLGGATLESCWRNGEPCGQPMCRKR